MNGGRGYFRESCAMYEAELATLQVQAEEASARLARDQRIQDTDEAFRIAAELEMYARRLLEVGARASQISEGLRAHALAERGREH